MKTCSVEGCGRKHLARGLCVMHYSRQRLTGSVGEAGPRQAAYGQGTVNHNGYRLHSKKGEKKFEHVLVVEQALGKPLPSEAVVHHVDGDPLNNNPKNLVVCPNQEYHMLIHRRQRALDACGHADWLKCKYCKQYDAVENLYVNPKGYASHRACAAQYLRDWVKRGRENAAS